MMYSENCLTLSLACGPVPIHEGHPVIRNITLKRRTLLNSVCVWGGGYSSDLIAMNKVFSVVGRHELNWVRSEVRGYGHADGAGGRGEVLPAVVIH